MKQKNKLLNILQIFSKWWWKLQLSCWYKITVKQIFLYTYINHKFPYILATSKIYVEIIFSHYPKTNIHTNTRNYFITSDKSCSDRHLNTHINIANRQCWCLIIFLNIEYLLVVSALHYRPYHYALKVKQRIRHGVKQTNAALTYEHR